ncbi:MliC family protein [Flavobacterium sp. LHD-85]|uniref:MliC family protein n=1 Tax=Flavobacterium sp. LHD-85 TaxID=3071410 RepID=UPI0027E1CA3D|nr:MliC family protein [Flavobacterium sp. LHD-85]MDQ6531951.1 MliC family protein [Flavobacterium sp. LHD-85]
MKTKKIISAILIILFLNSCKESPKQKETEAAETKKTEQTNDEIVTNYAVSKDGKKLEMSFNNTKNMVFLNFNGDNIELTGQKPASGIWYKNDHYELRGKGNIVELKKDGKLIFTNNDKIVITTIKNDKNQTLEMIFDNTANTATVYLDGTEINLNGQETASGIFYKNEQYQLRGKGENIELNKDGKVIFKK